MNQDVTNARPDQTLFRTVVSDVENAAGLLLEMLPTPLVKGLVWETLRREPDDRLAGEEPGAIGAAVLFSMASRHEPSDRLYLLLDYADEEKGDPTDSDWIVARQERIEDFLLAKGFADRRPRVLSVIVRRSQIGEPPETSEGRWS